MWLSHSSLTVFCGHFLSIDGEISEDVFRKHHCIASEVKLAHIVFGFCNLFHLHLQECEKFWEWLNVDQWLSYLRFCTKTQWSLWALKNKLCLAISTWIKNKITKIRYIYTLLWMYAKFLTLFLHITTLPASKNRATHWGCFSAIQTAFSIFSQSLSDMKCLGKVHNLLFTSSYISLLWVVFSLILKSTWK